MTEKPKIFISYSHQDKRFLKELKKHLKQIERENLADIFYDGDIEPGKEFDKEIKKRILEADIILLLISINFINSDYIYSVELKTALERHDNGLSKVIPIILSDCNWKNIAPLSKLLALPKDGKPITDYNNTDKPYTYIVKQLFKIILGYRIPIKKKVKIAKKHIKQEKDSYLNEKNNILMPWREYWNQLNKFSDILSYCDYRPDFIFGISNGGLIVADLLSRLSFPNTPVFSLWVDRQKYDGSYFNDEFNIPLIEKISEKYKAPKILLVDDNVSSGLTFIKAIDLFKNIMPDGYLNYLPLFTKNKNFLDIAYMDELILWNNESIKSVLDDNFNITTMHFTNYYEFPYEKGIKNIS